MARNQTQKRNPDRARVVSWVFSKKVFLAPKIATFSLCSKFKLQSHQMYAKFYLQIATITSLPNNHDFKCTFKLHLPLSLLVAIATTGNPVISHFQNFVFLVFISGFKFRAKNTDRVSEKWNSDPRRLMRPLNGVLTRSHEPWTAKFKSHSNDLISAVWSNSKFKSLGAGASTGVPLWIILGYYPLSISIHI